MISNPYAVVPAQPTEAMTLRAFDSVAAALPAAVTTVSSTDRENQSLIEHVRGMALHIVGDLVDAVSDGTLEDSELPTDRLDALMIEVLDASDDEEGTLEDALAGSIADAFSSLGVDESVIAEIFGDNVEAADAAIEAAATTVIANMPDEGDELDEFTREFIFGEANEGDAFDSAAKFKAKNGAFSHRKVGGRNVAYRGTLAIRQGKKTVVNKRLPGQKVRLSAAQKAGMKKARLHAMTANSIKKRVKSFKKGRKLGLY